MKEKIFSFIVGILVGAIIVAGGFLFYENMDKKEEDETIERTKIIQDEKKSSNNKKNKGKKDNQEIPAELPSNQIPEENSLEKEMTKRQKSSQDEKNNLNESV